MDIGRGRRGHKVRNWLNLQGFWEILAEGVSKSVYLTLMRTRSPEFEKPLSRRRELCAGPLSHSLQFACNLHASMGPSVGEDVRRKVGFGWVALRHLYCLARTRRGQFGQDQLDKP